MRFTLICAWIVSLFTIVQYAAAEDKNAFLGTWKLSAKKSHFLVPEDTYVAGERTYLPTPDGERVRWRMVTRNGTTETGEYTVRCQDGECESEVAKWSRKDERTVEGAVLNRGVVQQVYRRSVSPNGKVLTTVFYDPSTRATLSVQVWERQQ